jgi:hypothetical protein
MIHEANNYVFATAVYQHQRKTIYINRQSTLISEETKQMMPHAGNYSPASEKC